MEAAFDTLAYAERLKAAEIETSHAKAHVDALRIAFSEGVATKADVREVRADITRIEENMATKTDLARLETQLQRSINRVVFAMAGTAIALAAAIIAAIGLMM